MSGECVNLGATVHADCSGPDCFSDYPHTHQHWLIWPDYEDRSDQ